MQETAVDARLRAAAAGTIPWAEVLTKQSATGLYTGPVLALDYCRHAQRGLLALARCPCGLAL